MTKKTTSPMLLESEPRVGFRIHSNGEVEVLTGAETLALVLRAIREGMRRIGWSRLKPTLH
ncbi:hypothetical protein RAD15_19245 [Bradyrhizobium sp. 14AA]